MSNSAHDVFERRNKSFDLRIADRASASCWLSVIFNSLTSPAAQIVGMVRRDLVHDGQCPRGRLAVPMSGVGR